MTANRFWLLAGLLGLAGLHQRVLAQALPERQAERGHICTYVAPVPTGGQAGPANQAQGQPTQQETTPPIEQRRRLGRSFRVTKTGQAFALDTR